MESHLLLSPSLERFGNHATFPTLQLHKHALSSTFWPQRQSKISHRSAQCASRLDGFLTIASPQSLEVGFQTWSCNSQQHEPNARLQAEMIATYGLMITKAKIRARGDMVSLDTPPIPQPSPVRACQGRLWLSPFYLLERECFGSRTQSLDRRAPSFRAGATARSAKRAPGCVSAASPAWRQSRASIQRVPTHWGSSSCSGESLQGPVDGAGCEILCR